MPALYHTGPVAEALDVYADGYTYMRENLGLDLGARLRQLQWAILARDECLEIRSSVGRDFDKAILGDRRGRQRRGH